MFSAQQSGLLRARLLRLSAFLIKQVHFLGAFAQRRQTRHSDVILQLIISNKQLIT